MGPAPPRPFGQSKRSVVMDYHGLLDYVGMCASCSLVRRGRGQRRGWTAWRVVMVVTMAKERQGAPVACCYPLYLARYIVLCYLSQTARHHTIGVNPITGAGQHTTMDHAHAIVRHNEHMCVATANNSVYVYEPKRQIVVDTRVPQV